MASKIVKNTNLSSNILIGTVFFVGIAMFVFISVLVTQLNQSQTSTTNASELSR